MASSAALQELVKACKDAALLHLQSLLKLESTPFTQNSHYLSEKTAKTLARFKDARSGKDVMMDEIRRFKARKQTGAPSKRRQDATSASANPFNFSTVNSFAGFSGTWSSSTAARQTLTSPTTSAQKTPQSAFSQPSLSKPNIAQGEASVPSSSSAAQWGALLSNSAAAVRPVASSLASTVHPQVASAAPSLAEEEAAAEREMLETEALAILTKLGYTGLKVEDLGKLNPPDEFEEELQVMAEVRAYFHVAYKVSRPRVSSRVVIIAEWFSASADHRLRPLVH